MKYLRHFNGHWVGSNSSNLYHSTTGTTFTTNAFYNIAGFSLTNQNDITYSLDRNMWIIVADGGRMVRRNNVNPIVIAGNNWIENNVINVFGTSNINAIHYANGRFIAVANDGKIGWSINGSGWNTSVTGFTNHLRGVYYHDNYWMVVGDGGLIAVSIDNGNTWVDKSPGIDTAFRNIICFKGIWIAITNPGIYVSQ